MAAATAPAPAICLATIPPVPPPAVPPTASAPSITAPTPAGLPNTVQSAQPVRTNGKFLKFCGDVKRVCSNVEIWVLYMTIIGLAVALLGLPYMLESTKDSHKSLALAKWTATKDFWEHCSSQNETTTGPLTPECTKALATPLPPPPLGKRGFPLLSYSSLDGGISPVVLRAVSIATAYFGLFVVCISLAVRSALYVPRRPFWQWLWPSPTLEHLSTSTSSTFNETINHVPIALPRLSAYSSAIPPPRLVTAELRQRAKSSRAALNTHQGEVIREDAAHSVDDNNRHDPDGSTFDRQSVLIPDPDSDESDTDTAYLPLPPTAVTSGMHGSQQPQDDSFSGQAGEDLASVANWPISIANVASGKPPNLGEADQAPTEEPEELEFGVAQALQFDNTASVQNEQGQIASPYEKKDGPNVAPHDPDPSTRLLQPTPIQPLSEEVLTSWFDDKETEETPLKPTGLAHKLLTKALAKAKAAVILDNAEKFDSAIEAYYEACDLLQQVKVRMRDMEDRKKLSAIRKTYTDRIAELHDLEDTSTGPAIYDLPDDVLQRAMDEDQGLSSENSSGWTRAAQQAAGETKPGPSATSSADEEYNKLAENIATERQHRQAVLPARESDSHNTTSDGAESESGPDLSQASGTSQPERPSNPRHLTTEPATKPPSHVTNAAGQWFIDQRGRRRETASTREDMSPARAAPFSPALDPHYQEPEWKEPERLQRKADESLDYKRSTSWTSRRPRP